MRTLGRSYAVAKTSKSAGTHHLAVFARKFVHGGPTVCVRTTSLVGMSENVEVIMINVIAGKDIGDEFQD